MMSAMTFSGAGKTDVGRARNHNEDFFVCDPAAGIYIVCDGMGGHAAGEVASRLAAETIHAALKAETDAIEGHAERGEPGAIERILRTAIEAGSARVFEHASSESGRHGMGTTCVAMLARRERVYVGHVGDSRAYMCRGKSVWQLTDDHTYLNEAVKAGWMTAAEAEKSPHAHMITRGVGIQASVKVDTLTVDVVDGDRFLICSDGLHSYTENLEELATLMRPTDLAGGVDHLIALANERGGSDNISALLVSYEAGEKVRRGRKSLSVDNDLRTLRHISLFRDLEMRELMRLGGVFKAEEHDKGASLIREGARDDSLFIIVEGSVEVRKGQATVATLKEGTHFGEMALLSRHPRSATVVAITPVRALRLERKQFMGLVRTEPAIAVKCLWEIAQGLSTRLDDAKLVETQQHAREAAASSRSGTRQMEILSPFRDRD